MDCSNTDIAPALHQMPNVIIYYYFRSDARRSHAREKVEKSPCCNTGLMHDEAVAI